MAARQPSIPPPPSAERPRRLSFGPFDLDLRRGMLLRADAAIALRPKTWLVLLYLAERPGLLVSRDDLLDAVWPDVAVTPDTVSKSIGELRLALDDRSRTPRFIETVNRRGYRFLPDVRAIAARSAPAADDAPARAGAFVGREPELELLAARLGLARAGQRQFVFISGPAGVGKTALIDAFLASRAVIEPAGPLWVARADCFEHLGPQEPYLPVFEALQRLARPPGVERLLRMMRRAAPMWLAQMPWLVGEEDAEALRRSLQGVRPERMPRELATLLEALTADVTVLLVLEDLHWSDAATVDLLTLLAHHREPARLLVIGTFRPAEAAVHEHALANAVRAMQMRQQCVHVSLHDLSPPDVHEYLAARFPRHDFPRALGDLMHAHTGGQPLFVEAVVGQMLSRGWILDTSPGWALSAAPDQIDLGVPDDVRQLIETQLEQLTPGERRVLEAASVAGRDITAHIVAAPLGCSVAAAEAECERMARGARFLRVAGTVACPDGSPGHRYAFTHELRRQVVYEAIPAARRAQLHRRIGEALEAAHGARATEIAPQLALHFRHGGDPTRAQHYLAAAGARARQRFASREAIAYFDAALALTDQLSDAAQRRRRELEVRRALGRALAEVDGFAAESVRANYERVSELAGEQGDATARFEAVYARWYGHAVHGQRDATIALAGELEALARQAGTREPAVIAASVQLRTAFYDGRFAEAPRHMEAMRARQGAGGQPAVAIDFGVDPLVAGTLHHAGALWHLGDTEGARATAQHGVDRARAIGNPLTLSAALAQRALVELLCRDAGIGSDLAEEAVTLSAQQGFALWNAFASALAGWALIQRGRATDGIAAIERAMRAWLATGAGFFLAYFHAFLAEGLLRGGAWLAAREAADAGLAVAASTLDRGYEPELWRLRAETLLAADQSPTGRPRSGRKRAPAAAAGDSWREAERCLRRALELARAAQSRSLELRAATTAAQAWHARGRRREARTVLQRICARFAAESGADLIAARAVLAELARAR